MKRREFLGGAAAVGISLLMPQATEPELLPTIAIDPEYTWGMDATDGFRFTPVVMPGPMQIYTSEDGGNTWKLSELRELGWLSEPSQEWVTDLSAYDSNSGLYVG